jgi:NADH-quinone oxidoreductase subunit L
VTVTLTRGAALESAQSHGVEWTLMLLSVGVAVAGILVARHFYLANPEIPARLARAWPRAYALLLNKYYVDELYDAAIVNPLLRLFRWSARVFDLRVIDGIVNGVGSMVVGWARSLRRVQTGFVMNYALTMLLGALAVVAFLLARGPR